MALVETPWFFVSYARGDNETRLTQFIDRLTEEVRRRVGDVTPDQLRFFDKEAIQPGMYWRTTLLDAVCQSKSIVCFCSRASFQSDYCAKEFQAFRTTLIRTLARLSRTNAPASSEEAKPRPVLNATPGVNG